MKTGSSLFNDVLSRRMEQKGLGSNCRLLVVSSKEELINAFETIRKVEIFELANPIVHFEMHGDDNGLELSSGEHISWTEIQFYLLQLNGICENNLFITMATCKGGYLFKTINPRLWTPFWGFVGSFEDVTGQEVLDNFSPFYDEFLQSSDFNLAVEALNSANEAGYSRFRFRNTEYIFKQAYENYLQQYLTPEMIEIRVGSFFSECRPLPEFNFWSDKMIKDYARVLILDKGNDLKKRLMRKFFMLDVFPLHEKYYDEFQNSLTEEK